MTYKVENCIKCGGTHWGSYECPFTDAQAAEYRAAQQEFAKAASEQAPSKQRFPQLSECQMAEEIERIKRTLER